MTAASTVTVALDEAFTKWHLALNAHKEGDAALRNAFLTQAADRFRAARYIKWADWCMRAIEDPARFDVFIG